MLIGVCALFARNGHNGGVISSFRAGAERSEGDFIFLCVLCCRSRPFPWKFWMCYIGSDSLNIILTLQSLVELVRGIGPVANQSRWEFVKPASGRRFGN